jgi:HlyD family secretion protein
MTAYVNLTASKRENVLRVPASALRFTPPAEQISSLQRLFGKRPEPVAVHTGGQDTKIVYLLHEGGPFAVSVKTGAADDEYVEIAGDGIAEGDTVILSATAVRR